MTYDLRCLENVAMYYTESHYDHVLSLAIQMYIDMDVPRKHGSIHAQMYT